MSMFEQSFIKIKGEEDAEIIPSREPSRSPSESTSSKKNTPTSPLFPEALDDGNDNEESSNINLEEKLIEKKEAEVPIVNDRISETSKEERDPNPKNKNNNSFSHYYDGFHLKYFKNIPEKNYDIYYPLNSEHLIFSEENLSSGSTQSGMYTSKDLGKGREISFITLEKLLEYLTSPKNQYPDIFDMCLYGYLFFTTETELFDALIRRFRCAPGLMMSKSEESAFKINCLKIIQIKVLIFLQFWFKLYRDPTLINQKGLEEIFVEALYLIFISPFGGKWVSISVSKLLLNIDDLEFSRSLKAVNEFSSVSFSNPVTGVLTSILLPIYNQICDNDRRRELAKQLCLFDSENLGKVNIYEFVNKAKNLKDTPNLKFLGEMFNNLSKAAVFLVLYPRKISDKIEAFEFLVELVEELIKLNNFNSSFAVYIGLRSPAVERLQKLIGAKISRSHKNKLERFTMLFEVSNNQHNLREAQNKALNPSIPFPGVYYKDMLLIDENYKMMQKEDYTGAKSKMINYKKVYSLAAIIKRIEIFREHKYPFHKNELIYEYIKYIPNISEDYIYQLSYDILPL